MCRLDVKVDAYRSNSHYFLVRTTMDRQSKPGSRKGRPNYPPEFKMHLAKARRSIAYAGGTCGRGQDTSRYRAARIGIR